MAGTFRDRIRELKGIVGEGDLVGSVEVNQAYAQNQHESVWFKHQHGGQALFLHTPLMEGFDSWYQKIADRVLEPGGAKSEMVNAVGDLNDRMRELAPKEGGNYLGRSGKETVTDDGEEVHSKGPEVPRLSAAELEALGDVEGS